MICLSDEIYFNNMSVLLTFQESIVSDYHILRNIMSETDVICDTIENLADQKENYTWLAHMTTVTVSSGWMANW